MQAVLWTAFAAGVAGGLLGIAARRVPIVGWITLSPLGLALATCGGWAALTGAMLGSVLHGSAMLSQPARLRPLGFLFGGLGWGLSAGVGGVLFDALLASRLVSGPVALLCSLPVVSLLATLPMRLAGAPRWVYAALACTQEPWPVVIRAGWFGGDTTVSALLALTATAACLLVPGIAWGPGVAVSVIAFVLATLTTSAWALARTRRSIPQERRVRIAAVVVNGSPPPGVAADGLWPLHSLEYRDVEATIERYAPHVKRAAKEGAELIVLPEVAVFADGDGRERWLDAVGIWASELGTTVVAPYFDSKAPANTLTVVEPSGRRLAYDKQHPAPGLEPAPRGCQLPGPLPLERGWSVSTVICVDLDYEDLVLPVRAAAGLLVVPANDWMGFEEVHDRSAVWAAVLGETTVLRATGHGICSVRDGAGRLLARSSSLDGPAVLIVDAPLASRGVEDS